MDLSSISAHKQTKFQHEHWTAATNKKEKSAPINFEFVSHKRRENIFWDGHQPSESERGAFERRQRILNVVFSLVRFCCCFNVHPHLFLFEVIFLLICWRYCEIRINLSVCQSGWEGYLNFSFGWGFLVKYWFWSIEKLSWTLFKALN